MYIKTNKTYIITNSTADSCKCISIVIRTSSDEVKWGFTLYPSNSDIVNI